MAGLPEIIGDRQDSVPGVAEEQDRHEDAQEPPEQRPRELVNHPGAYLPPLELRLIDFSGGGERSPPGDLTTGRISDTETC
jgi:hypothetical protein